MNKGTEDLKKLVDVFKNMTVEEYEELCDEADSVFGENAPKIMFLDPELLITVDSIQISSNTSRTYCNKECSTDLYMIDDLDNNYIGEEDLRWNKVA